MTRLIIAFSIMIVALQHGLAQAPQGFNYQALARDANGEVLSNKELGVQIFILKNNPEGDGVYSENHQVTTNAQGIFSLQVGTGNVEQGSFSEIAWGEDIYFLSVSIAQDENLTDFVFLGTQQLMSVPYALFANTSGKKSCPEGFAAVNNQYCIQEEEQVAANWFEANVTCSELNAEICSWSQWYYACQKSSLNLSNMTDNWEWINDGGDDKSNHAKAVGEGGCTADNSFKAEFSVNAFRCCFSR